MFENLGAVVGCKSGILSVDPYRYRTVASERNLTILVYLYRGNGFEEFAGALTGSRDVGGEYFPIKLETHLAAYSFHNNLLENFRIVNEGNRAEINVPTDNLYRALLVDTANVHYFNQV